MNKWNIIGIVFVFISMLLSLVNILSVKITGAIIGINIESSLLTILTFVFFFGGLIFLSRIGKGLAGLVVGISIAGGINYKVQTDKERQYIEDTKINSSWKTEEGKFQRTYRWDDILDKTEKEYNLPRGLLKGLAMRESYGDPLRLNEGKDGGAGLFMFQPGTARLYGLKVYGNSKKLGVDKKHGKELRELIAKNKNDYRKMGEIDERFDIRKAAEAAARYLKDDYNRYHSWDKALSAYNQGTPAPNAKEKKHVKAVNEYKKYYRKHDKINHNSLFWKLAGKGNSNKKIRR
jgi:hypothetical protein